MHLQLLLFLSPAVHVVLRFWTLIEGAGRQKEEVIGGIVNFARAKLICNHDIKSPRAMTPKAKWAVVDVRLGLTWGPKREVFRFEADLVASHMRVAYSIPHSRTYIRSGYPREPILGEAAAQQLGAFRMFSSSTMLDILMEDVRDPMVDLGARGEIVARALLTSAYDRAVEREQSNTNGTPFYSRGCDMINFIRELFVEDYAEEILSSVPDNVKSNTSFGEAFKSAKIRFTQFVKAVDDIGTTSEAMYAAFIRGVAIICATSQEAVDIMMPVLVKDGPLSENVMTSFMIQGDERFYSHVHHG